MSIIEYKVIYEMHELKHAAPPGMAVKGYALPAFENISEEARPNYYSPISPTKTPITPQQVWFVFRPARHIPSRPKDYSQFPRYSRPGKDKSWHGAAISSKSTKYISGTPLALPGTEQQNSKYDHRNTGKPFSL